MPAGALHRCFFGELGGFTSPQGPGDPRPHLSASPTQGELCPLRIHEERRVEAESCGKCSWVHLEVAVAAQVGIDSTEGAPAAKSLPTEGPGWVWGHAVGKLRCPGGPPV